MLAHSELEVGSIAPDINLEGSTGWFSLVNEYRGKQNVVIYFMRKFDCGICRGHVAQLKQMYEQLKAKNTAVVVIAGGLREEAEELSQALKLPFPVLADVDRVVAQRYGYDKTLGMIERSGTVLVDQRGQVQYLLRVTIPTGSLDKKALLKAVEQLPATTAW